MGAPRAAVPKSFGLTAQIFSKLIAASFLILLITLVGVDILASRAARSWYIDTLTSHLSDKARMLSVMETNGAQNRARLLELAQASKGRITSIRKDGSVAADSSVEDWAAMANHADRPEVASALRGTSGASIRKSETTGVEYLYVAVPSGDGALRLAMTVSELERQVGEIRLQLILAVSAAFLPVLVLSLFFARYISRRLGRIIQFAQTLAEGNFTQRLSVKGSDELSVLSLKLNETAGKLQAMFDELQHEQAELMKLERIRKDFVINVSHELRTPLASIQGYAETLLDGALDDEENRTRFVAIIKQNAERLTSLTADLLTLSRIELKTQQFNTAAYYATPLIRDTVDALRPLAERKKIELVAEMPPPKTEVFCDAEAFHQVLTNLIDNALKYTPEGGTVFVGATPVTRDGHEEVEFWVRDTGVGIPQEDLPRLFERFYRVDKARSRELGGTGLGLAIVKHLVRAQGGDVWVQSVVNEGSTFSFRLPVEEVPLSERENQDESELTAPGLNGGLRSR